MPLVRGVSLDEPAPIEAWSTACSGAVTTCCADFAAYLKAQRRVDTLGAARRPWSAPGHTQRGWHGAVLVEPPQHRRLRVRVWRIMAGWSRCNAGTAHHRAMGEGFAASADQARKGAPGAPISAGAAAVAGAHVDQNRFSSCGPSARPLVE